jgi:hypothetical protein
MTSRRGLPGVSSSRSASSRPARPTSTRLSADVISTPCTSASEVPRRHALLVAHREPRGEQGNRDFLQDREPAYAPRPPASVEPQCSRYVFWRVLDLGTQHPDDWGESLLAHRTVEAAENLDLLDELALADEGALASGPVDVSLLGQIEHRLPNRREAHAECLGQPLLPRQLCPGLEPPLLDTLQHCHLDLMVQRRWAVPAHVCCQASLYCCRHPRNDTKL